VIEVAKGLQDLGAFVAVLSRRAGSWQAKSERFQGFMIYRVYRGILAPLRQKRGGHSGRGGRGRRRGFFPLLYRTYLSTVFALCCGLLAAKLVKEHNLGVVVERETSFGAGAIASMLTGRALVLEVNGPRFSPISSRRASVITAYSYSMVGESLRSKTRIVDAGVNTELFKPDPIARLTTRERYGLGGSPVICYVGTFQTWHGVDDLVRASQLVLREHPETKFLMVGPNFGAVRHLAETSGVADSFVFTGPVRYELVPQYVNAADILVSPTNPSKSKWTRIHGPPEQFKIFEYMACRKPVIMTAVGPMQRIVTNGITGLTVPPADCEALAGAICNLIRDRELAESIATKAYVLASEKYAWLNHTKEIYDVITSTLNRLQRVPELPMEGTKST